MPTLNLTNIKDEFHAIALINKNSWEIKLKKDIENGNYMNFKENIGKFWIIKNKNGCNEKLLKTYIDYYGEKENDWYKPILKTDLEKPS